MTTSITVSQALKWLADYRRAKEAAKEANRLGDLIKAYLATVEETELSDSETGYGVRLQERRLPGTWPLLNVPEELILRAQKLGLLTIDNKVYEALDGKAAETIQLSQYRQPGGVTVALVPMKEVRE